MWRALFFLVCLGTLAACAPPQKLSTEQTAEKYLREGELYLEKGMYEEALQAWQKLRDTFYSPETNILAEMKIAETNYRAKKYPEAAAAYEGFLKSHPNHERVPQMMFDLGMSYYQQILTIDRDQTATRNALVTFTTLRDRFPDFSGSEPLVNLIAVCRNRLAGHEIYVGDFYLRYGYPAAAVGRLEQAVKQYPDYAQIDRAYYLLAKAYVETGNDSLASATLDALSRSHPQSSYLRRTRDLVE